MPFNMQKFWALELNVVALDRRQDKIDLAARGEAQIITVKIDKEDSARRSR